MWVFDRARRLVVVLLQVQIAEAQHPISAKWDPRRERRLFRESATAHDVVRIIGLPFRRRHLPERAGGHGQGIQRLKPKFERGRPDCLATASSSLFRASAKACGMSAGVPRNTK